MNFSKRICKLKSSTTSPYVLVHVKFKNKEDLFKKINKLRKAGIECPYGKRYYTKQCKLDKFKFLSIKRVFEMNNCLCMLTLHKQDDEGLNVVKINKLLKNEI